MSEILCPVQTTIEGVEKPPRPKVSAQIIEQGVKSFCDENKYSEEEMQDIIKVFRSGMDGYELARELDDRCGWTINASDVDALDCVDHCIDEAHMAAVRQWVIDHDIQPALSVGATIKRGVIAGVAGDYSPACYLVKEHGCTQAGRHLLIKFEDAA